MISTRASLSISALIGAACLLSPANAVADTGRTIKEPDIVAVTAGSFEYRLSGEFLKDGFPVRAPVVDVEFDSPIQIMKYQVSRADYALCIKDNACGQTFKPINLRAGNATDLPVTGVSHKDALNYARWLSAKTGASWRLPTDTEWAYAAASRFYDDATGFESAPDDPSRQMLSKYRQSVDLDREADPMVRPRGAFGANERGLYDLSGNVWEWTDTCYRRSAVNADNTIISDSDNDNCGVRVVEGRHRAYMTIFVQDAKSGGCSVGAPPDYLGFRLVKDEPDRFSLKSVLRWFSLY